MGLNIELPSWKKKAAMLLFDYRFKRRKNYHMCIQTYSMCFTQRNANIQYIYYSSHLRPISTIRSSIYKAHLTASIVDYHSNINIEEWEGKCEWINMNLKMFLGVNWIWFFRISWMLELMTKCALHVLAVHLVFWSLHIYNILLTCVTFPKSKFGRMCWKIHLQANRQKWNSMWLWCRWTALTRALW